jgi:hypothetical protein
MLGKITPKKIFIENKQNFCFFCAVVAFFFASPFFAQKKFLLRTKTQKKIFSIS